MQESSFDIHEGMDVLGTDGEKIGIIEQLYIGAARSDASITWNAGGGPTGPAGLSRPDTGAGAVMHSAGRTSGGAATMGTSSSWFMTKRGGILGIGSRELYIPFDAIAGVTGNEITVNCVKDQCDDLFGRKPGWMERDGDAR